MSAASASRLRGLIAVISSMALTALVFGFTYPMFATRLDTMGVPDFWIGLNAAAQSAGVFLVAWFAPRLITHFGPVRVMVAMTGVKLLAVLLCILFPAYWPWLLMRMVIGGAGSVLWIAAKPGSTKLPRKRAGGGNWRSTASRWVSAPWPASRSSRSWVTRDPGHLSP